MSCKIVPDKWVGLFEKLKLAFGRKTAAIILNKISHPAYPEKSYFKYDRAGLPTFESVIASPMISEFIGEETISLYYDANTEHLEDNIENSKSLLNKAASFNKTNDYLLNIVVYDSNGKLYIKTVVNNKRNLDTAYSQQAIAAINDTMVNFLSDAGITISHLSQKQVAAGRVGLTDFNAAYANASSFTLLIKVANNMEGFKAITEEASHLIIGAHRNKPIIQRSIALLKEDKDLLRSVLGEEYNSVYSFYAQKYDNPELHEDEILELVAEEALGQIFRDQIIEKTKLKIAKRPPLLQRMFSYIINKFKGINPKAYQDTLDLIKQNIDTLTTAVINKKIKLTKEQVWAAQREAQFNALSSRIEAQINFLKTSALDAYRAGQLMLRNKGKATLEHKKLAMRQAESLKNSTLEYIKSGETMEGIANYCSEAVSLLDIMYNRILHLDEYSEAEQGEILRNIHLHLQRFEKNIKDLNLVVTEEYFQDEDIAHQHFIINYTQNPETIQKFTLVSPDPSNMQNFAELSPEEAVRKILLAAQNMRLSADQKNYIDNANNSYIRVTTAIGAVEDAVVADSERLAAWTLPSTNIGTGMDSFVRDLIEGVVTKGTDGFWHHPSGHALTEIYPNASSTQLNTFAEQINTFIQSQKARGITLVAKDITVNGVVPTTDALGRTYYARVAGQLDVLGYDADGNWYIYDMKTHRGAIDTEKKRKWQRQLSLYAQLLRQTYGLNVKETHILPIHVSYPTPKEAGGLDTYSLKSPDSNQLLVNGEEYKKAYPKLEPLISLDLHSLKFDYSRLLNDASAGYGSAKQAIVHLTNDVSGAISRLRGEFEKKAKIKFINFLKKYYGDTVTINIGNGTFKEVPVEEVVGNWEKDSTSLQKFFTSMADNPDVILQMVDGVFKNTINKKNLKSIEFSQKIVALGVKYEKLGIKDYSFMFEDGNKYYINKEYDRTAYNKAYSKKIEELKNKYKYENMPVGSVEHALYKKELEEWRKLNTKDNKPDPAKYPSKWSSLTSAQKDFYEEWMGAKKVMDILLGEEKTELTNTIKIRKRDLERTKAIFSKDGWEAIKGKVKSDFKKSFDDDINYKEAKGLRGFNNEEILRLPALYTTCPDSELYDLSKDVISTLIAYGDACLEYSAMNSIVDELELGKEVLKNRKIKLYRGHSSLIESRRAGNTIEYSQIYKNTETSTFYELYKNFIEALIYNRYLKDAGETKGIDNLKIVSGVKTLASTVLLGFNAASGIANLLTGIAMQNIEAASGEYFNAKELAKADAIYIEELMKYLPDIGSRIMRSKLALMDELFNIRLLTKKELRNKRFINKNFFTRLTGPRLQFICQTAGDHWLYNRTAIAIMVRYKLKDKYGKVITLWDAYETVPIDPKIPDAGNKLRLKEGIKKLDGSAFTEDDISDVINNITSVNLGLFGVYNDEDRVMANQIAGWRLFMHYRDFFPRQWRKRFGVATSNFMLGKQGKAAIVEGFYRTTGRFAWDCIKDLVKGDIQACIMRKDDLKDWEKANIKRTLMESVQVLTVVILGALFAGADSKDPWYKKWASYLLLREKTELGALTPFMAPVELARIVKSPIAASNVISDIANILSPIYILNAFNKVESGEYKGSIKLWKDFMQSPATLWYKTIKRQLNIDKAEDFYK